MTLAIAAIATLLIASEPLGAVQIVSAAIPTVAELAGSVQQTPPAEQLVDQQTRDALLALAMGLAIFSSSLALGIAYGIRRRIDQIAGPVDDDDD